MGSRLRDPGARLRPRLGRGSRRFDPSHPSQPECSSYFLTMPCLPRTTWDFASGSKIPAYHGFRGGQMSWAGGSAMLAAAVIILGDDQQGARHAGGRTLVPSLPAAQDDLHRLLCSTQQYEQVVDDPEAFRN